MPTLPGRLACSRFSPPPGWGRWFAVACVSVVCLLAPQSAPGGDVPPPPLVAPAPRDDRFQFAYETAVCFDLNNPNNYVTNSHLLILRWQPYHTEQFFHTSFTFTRQFDIDAELVPFWRGPEQHYFGGGVGVRLLYGRTGSHFSLFMEGRLNVGAIDSSGPPHGEGQDLTFNPMGDLGVMYEVTGRQKVSLGIMFSHFSNAGLSEPERPNIGINTLGPMLEWNVSF